MSEVSGSKVILLVGIVGSLLLSHPAAQGDFVFGEPEPVAGLNTASAESSPCITADGLELYFASNRDHGDDRCYDDIWVATRASTDEPWGVPQNLGAPVNHPYEAEVNPCISADGLELYFSDIWPSYVNGCLRPGGYGKGDIWVSKRESREADWGEPVNLGPMVNSVEYDGTPHLSVDGLCLYFSRTGNGGDLYVSTRPTKEDPWGPPVDLGAPINMMAQQDYLFYPFLSYDGLSLFFTAIPWPWAGNAGGFSNGDIFVSTRPSRDDGWGVPSRLPVLSSARHEMGLTFARGGSTLYFGRSDPYIASPSFVGDPARATSDIWQVEVTPIVDLNGDGIVDAADFGRLIDSWHTNDPLCDIAPPPMGDGFVDVQDLVVLAEYLPPSLECVAHWMLDEVQGTMAYDSVGGSDAAVVGDPTWRPTDGKIGGALQFDGVDDYISTDFAADPKVGSVRVVAWIKTGVAGRVIVSQVPGTLFGSIWLATNASDGTLMTGMMLPLPALYSTAVAADGQWHEVAVEWDGIYRRLFLDREEVSRDIAPMSLPPIAWDGTLNIGTGEGFQPDSFFSGLIDDVRIYQSAVEP